jgi:AAA domain (Cdc48 subfamily)
MGQSEGTTGEPSRFNTHAGPSPLQCVVGLVQEVCPELGCPERRPTNDGGEVYDFTGPESLQLRVGGWGNDDVQLGIQVSPAGRYLDVGVYSELLNKLGKHWRWSAEKENDQWCWRVTTQISPDQIGGVRETVIRDQLAHLCAWVAKVLPTEKPSFDEEALRKEYGKLTEVLSPILPWSCEDATGQLLQNWAAEAVQLLSSGINVAVPGATAVEQDLAAAVLADRLLGETGRSLGLVSRSSFNAERLAQLAAKAPGTVAVAARILQMGSQTYQLGSESVNLLASLTAGGMPAVFLGTFSELQHVFHGGQGATNDPLQPAVCRLPELPLHVLIAFAVARECRKGSIPGAQFQKDALLEVAEALADMPQGNARRLVGQTATHVVCRKLKGRQIECPRRFVMALNDRAETLGGLSRRPRVKRSEAIQQRMLERITHPDFLPFLEEHLLGQGPALREFHMKLTREVATRPSHQPLRISSLGEPGTGKSRSLELLAEWLEVPYVNIDMASLSDPHMAMTQLLGSGTGFVGSDQAGRLEHIARHFEGVVAECSDMDHAHPSVQSAVGDLFLSVFETGEAQSGRGYMFSCANLIFGFTLNLPAGRDERMYLRRGFGKAPSHEQVQQDVRQELKRLMSGAFWSRMGDPILFAPLTGEVRVEIVRRALCDAANMGLARFGVAGAQVAVTEAVAERVMGESAAPGAGFGARGLLEMARGHAAQAVVSLFRTQSTTAARNFELIVNDAGALVLREMSGMRKEQNCGREDA